MARTNKSTTINDSELVKDVLAVWEAVPEDVKGNHLFRCLVSAMNEAENQEALFDICHALLELKCLKKYRWKRLKIASKLIALNPTICIYEDFINLLPTSTEHYCPRIVMDEVMMAQAHFCDSTGTQDPTILQALFMHYTDYAVYNKCDAAVIEVLAKKLYIITNRNEYKLVADYAYIFGRYSDSTLFALNELCRLNKRLHHFSPWECSTCSYLVIVCMLKSCLHNSALDIYDCGFLDDFHNSSHRAPRIAKERIMELAVFCAKKEVNIPVVNLLLEEKSPLDYYAKQKLKTILEKRKMFAAYLPSSIFEKNLKTLSDTAEELIYADSDTAVS